MRTNLIATARSASKGVFVGSLAAVSFAVTGVALAAAGGPATPTPSTPNSHAASNAASHAATGKPTAKPTHSAKPEAPDANRSCPWPTPKVTAPRHDNGLHCGWYKPGHRDGKHPGKGNGGVDKSSPHPHPTGKGADDSNETD